MGQPQGKSKARTTRKKAPYNQDRSYQTSNLSIMKPTNAGYEVGRSRWYRDEHARDEQTLAIIALLIMIGGGTVLYIHFSGAADRFLDNAYNLYLWLR